MEKTLYITTISVLVNHTSYGNHLGYDSLLSILQEARMRWLKTISPDLSEINIDGNVALLVKDLAVTYESEAHHGDELTIEMSVADTSKTSFIIKYQVLNKTTNKNLASASTTLVCFDTNKSKVVKIPPLLRGSLDN